MPSTASFVAYVNMASLFSSSIFSGLEQELSSQVGQMDLEEFRELTGTDPWRDFYALSVLTEAPENGRERWGLAISGAFDPQRLIDTLEEQGPVSRQEHREATLSISVRLGSDIAFHARAEVESSEEARRLADVVRGLAALSTLSTGGTPSIESLEVQSRGTWLEVEFEIDADNVREWLRERKKAESASP